MGPRGLDKLESSGMPENVCMSPWSSQKSQVITPLAHATPLSDSSDLELGNTHLSTHRKGILGKKLDFILPKLTQCIARYCEVSQLLDSPRFLFQ